MEVQDHTGCVYASLKSMCLNWGITVDIYYYRRKKAGWSLKKTLETPVRKQKFFYDYKITDPKTGVEYTSIPDFCRHTGANRTKIEYRIKQGMSPELVTCDLNLRNVTSKDHLGNEFATRAAMCRYWGISYFAFVFRMINGWELERALTTPVKNNNLKGTKRKKKNTAKD